MHVTCSNIIATKINIYLNTPPFTVLVLSTLLHDLNKFLLIIIAIVALAHLTIRLRDCHRNTSPTQVIHQLAAGLHRAYPFLRGYLTDTPWLWGIPFLLPGIWHGRALAPIRPRRVLVGSASAPRGDRPEGRPPEPAPRGGSSQWALWAPLPGRGVSATSASEIGIAQSQARQGAGFPSEVNAGWTLQGLRRDSTRFAEACSKISHSAPTTY